MRLDSVVPPVFYPDPAQNTVLQLGLRILDPTQWMQIDQDFSQFQRHKLEQKNKNTERVCFALPGSEAAQQELHRQLLQHLVADHGNHFRLQGNTLCWHDELSWPSEFTSLWHSALWVQEDICLLENINESYQLTAASVCSPSNWKLEEKRGGDLDFIHRPVPDYADSLSDRVNRLFNNLKVSGPLLRYNWSIQATNELFWRDDLLANRKDSRGEDYRGEERYEKEVDEEKDQDTWFWRVERQTLRRLPRTGAIVFAIRIYLHDLSVLMGDENFLPQLQAILQRLPKNQLRYKALTRFINRCDRH